MFNAIKDSDNMTVCTVSISIHKISDLAVGFVYGFTVGIALGNGLDVKRVGVRVPVVFTSSKPALSTIQLPVQLVLGAVSPVCKADGA
jgi:hypothetical protein